MKKIIVVLTLLAFVFSFAGCATTSTISNPTKSDLKRIEKENNYNMIMGLSSFGGFIIGGVAGLIAGPENGKIVSMISYGLGGAVLGLGGGYVITQTMRSNEDKVDNSKADQYFRDYKNIQGKD